MHLKRFLSGIFILLISTQIFAQDTKEICEKERLFAEHKNPSGNLKLSPGSTYLTSDDTYLQESLKLANDVLKGKDSYTWGPFHDKNIALFHICAISEVIKLRDSKSGYNPTNQTNSATRSQQQIQSNNSSQSQNQSQSSDSQQAQQIQQPMQQSQQQAQQNQQRADQARQGKRKTHDPAAEAHGCLSLTNGSKLLGGFTNSCGYKVDFIFCNYKPKQGSWADTVDCEKGRNGIGGWMVGPYGKSTDHTNRNGTTYWFACKSPAFAIDGEYVPGQGLLGRCATN